MGAVMGVSLELAQLAERTAAAAVEVVVLSAGLSLEALEEPVLSAFGGGSKSWLYAMLHGSGVMQFLSTFITSMLWTRPTMSISGVYGLISPQANT